MFYFCGILSVVVALDRVSKIAAIALLSQAGSVVAIPGVLELCYTINRGIALGLLSGQWLATLTLPLAAAAAWLLVGRQYEATRYKWIASGLALGGFVGNFLDRLFWGYVVDMIFFPWLPWFICNMADLAICAGAVMLAASLLFRPQDWRRKWEG